MYRGAPTSADLEQAGVSVDDEVCASPNPDGWYYDKDEKGWLCLLWAENWPAMKFFTDHGTQWREGFSGKTGLDYNVLFHELDRLNLPRDEYDDLFTSIRDMERAALNEMRAKQ